MEYQNNDLEKICSVFTLIAAKSGTGNFHIFKKCAAMNSLNNGEAKPTPGIKYKTQLLTFRFNNSKKYFLFRLYLTNKSRNRF